MFQRLTTFLVLFATAITCSGQDMTFNQHDRNEEVNRIYVLKAKGKNCEGIKGEDAHIETLAEAKLLGAYDIVERRHLDEVLEEQRLSGSGILNEESAVELGINAGAEGIIISELGCIDGKNSLSVKLVCCETSEVFWSSLGIGATSVQLIDHIVYKLTGVKPVTVSAPQESRQTTQPRTQPKTYPKTQPKKSTASQCTGYAKSTGRRCRNKTTHPSGRCHQHR